LAWVLGEEIEKMFGITTNDIFDFVINYKWWIVALLPFAIAIMALKARG
tara:strand:- start:86 stop:232 length:147 start_codon:yes stop_codon:yes gene_type:complete